MKTNGGISPHKYLVRFIIFTVVATIIVMLILALALPTHGQTKIERNDAWNSFARHYNRASEAQKEVYDYLKLHQAEYRLIVYDIRAVKQISVAKEELREAAKELDRLEKIIDHEGAK